MAAHGSVSEWPKESDCKSDGSAFEGSNPSPPTIKKNAGFQVSWDSLFSLEDAVPCVGIVWIVCIVGGKVPLSKEEPR